MISTDESIAILFAPGRLPDALRVERLLRSTGREVQVGNAERVFDPRPSLATAGTHQAIVAELWLAIETADCVLVLAGEGRRSASARELAYHLVGMGLALGSGRRVVWCGGMENAFAHALSVRRFEDLSDMLLDEFGIGLGSVERQERVEQFLREQEERAVAEAERRRLQAIAQERLASVETVSKLPEYGATPAKVIGDGPYGIECDTFAGPELGWIGFRSAEEAEWFGKTRDIRNEWRIVVFGDVQGENDGNHG